MASASIVFITPEQSSSEDVRTALVAQKKFIKLLVIDEAHCIQEASEKYRPDFLKLGAFRPKLGVPVMALTATPTPSVRRCLPDTLAIPSFYLIEGLLDRPELFIEVRKVDGLGQLHPQFLKELLAAKGVTLVFCHSKNTVCSLFAEAKRTLKESVGAYHASLSDTHRSKVMRQLLRGELKCAFVTSALGMGINLPDVERVVVWGIPPTMLDLLQYFGRARRDRTPGRVTLMLSKHSHPKNPNAAPAPTPAAAPTTTSTPASSRPAQTSKASKQPKQRKQPAPPCEMLRAESPSAVLTVQMEKGPKQPKLAKQPMQVPAPGVGSARLPANQMQSPRPFNAMTSMMSKFVVSRTPAAKTEDRSSMSSASTASSASSASSASLASPVLSTSSTPTTTPTTAATTQTAPIQAPVPLSAGALKITPHLWCESVDAMAKQDLLDDKDDVFLYEIQTGGRCLRKILLGACKQALPSQSQPALCCSMCHPPATITFVEESGRKSARKGTGFEEGRAEVLQWRDEKGKLVLWGPQYVLSDDELEALLSEGLEWLQLKCTLPDSWKKDLMGVLERGECGERAGAKKRK